MQREWKLVAALALLAVLAAARVASTHRVFSATLDEPAHLGSGDEWLAGSYRTDPTHPPLARVLCALALRAAGVPAATSTGLLERGTELLYHRDAYVDNLARARKGNLVLLIVAVAATAAWARRMFSPAVSIASAAMFTTLPPILAHAGLVTTDLAVAAMLPLSLLALDRFLERPSFGRAGVLGIAVALGVLAKFSFLVFFPAAALVVLIARRPRRFAAAPAAAAILVTLAAVWGGYRFDVGKPTGVLKDAVFLFHYSAPEPLIGPARALAQQTMPAPALAAGLAALKLHDREGHAAYLLGRISREGWWYYFPVVFFYKTPLPFLVLAAWGARGRAAWICIGTALAVLLVAMTGSINIGVRHILPMYAPLAIVAAHGAVEIWKRAAAPFSRAAFLALLAWLFAGTAAAHPDYLPWFNELALPNPAHVAVDSNLDWGQDMLRLQEAARSLNIERLHIGVMTNMRLGANMVLLEGNARTPGWVAVSETPLAFGAYSWLRPYRPVRRIGQSIRLYRIPQ